MNLFVNGDNWGVMNIEEHVSKELIEKQKRKSTITLRFADEVKSAYRREFKKTYVKNNNLLSDAKLFTKIYQAKKTLKSDSARKYASYVIHNRKKSNTVKLYDIPSFAKLFILSEIWNDRHV